MAPAHPTDASAAAFIARLEGEASEAERLKYRRYFPERHEEFIGVRMGAVFAAARDFAGMDLDQIERLLEHDAHEVRAGAVRIMAEQAKARSTTDERLQALAALYLRRHDRIDDWDLVDLGAWEVLGRSLLDRPRDVLDELAASDDPWRRRSAITATFAFIRRDELDDTYRIATPARRRARARPQGGRLGPPERRRPRSRAAQLVPRGARRDDAAVDPPQRDREAAARRAEAAARAQPGGLSPASPVPRLRDSSPP